MCYLQILPDIGARSNLNSRKTLMKVECKWPARGHADVIIVTGPRGGLARPDQDVPVGLTTRLMALGSTGNDTGRLLSLVIKLYSGWNSRQTCVVL